MTDFADALKAALSERFGEAFAVPKGLSGVEELAHIATHRVCRRYTPQAVSPELLRLLCACALSAPTKSDLQQGDILILRDEANRRAICDLLPQMPWLKDAPVLLVFLANGRRVLEIARMRGKPFGDNLGGTTHAVEAQLQSLKAAVENTAPADGAILCKVAAGGPAEIDARRLVRLSCACRDPVA